MYVMHILKNEEGLIAFVPENEVIDEFHPRKVRNENLEVTDWASKLIQLD